MIKIDLRQLDQRERSIRPQANFVPYFAWFIATVLPVVQKAHFLRGGAGGGKDLSFSTVRSRNERWGYYRAAPQWGAHATGPYGVWTGNTARHTWGAKGRVSIRPFVATVQNDLDRPWVTDWWAARELDRQNEILVTVWWQAVLDGKTPRGARLRVSA